jgi:hypothetical protein
MDCGDSEGKREAMLLQRGSSTAEASPVQGLKVDDMVIYDSVLTALADVLHADDEDLWMGKMGVRRR